MSILYWEKSRTLSALLLFIPALEVRGLSRFLIILVFVKQNKNFYF